MMQTQNSMIQFRFKMMQKQNSMAIQTYQGNYRGTYKKQMKKIVTNAGKD